MIAYNWYSTRLGIPLTLTLLKRLKNRVRVIIVIPFLVILSSCAGFSGKSTAQLAPVRTIQTIYNISPLWSKDETYLVEESLDRRFFTPQGNSLLFSTLNDSQTSYAFKTIDMLTGQTLWQTDIPSLGVTRIHNGRIYHLYKYKTLEEAPVKDNQELPYCSFKQKSLLSVYDVYTGQLLWGYEYLGVNNSTLDFHDGVVYLSGTDDHGASRLLAKVDINSGTILAQQCAMHWEDKPVPVSPPDSVAGIGGSSFPATAVDNQEYGLGCMDDNRLCFVTQENRLNILAGNTKETLAFVEFDGEELNHLYVDIIVQNNLIAVHLNDSNQLFAFRLP